MYAVHAKCSNILVSAKPKWYHVINMNVCCNCKPGMYCQKFLIPHITSSHIIQTANLLRPYESSSPWQFSLVNFTTQWTLTRAHFSIKCVYRMMSYWGITRLILLHLLDYKHKLSRHPKKHCHSDKHTQEKGR